MIQRFALSGLVATGLHVGVAVTLIESLGFAGGPANAVAFVVATAFSYFANSIWTFSRSPSRRVAGRYLLVQILGLAFAGGVGSLFDKLSLHYGFGILLIVVVMPTLSYVLHRRWTFRSDA